MALPTQIDPLHHTGLVQIRTTKAPSYAHGGETVSSKEPAKPGEIRLAEIRPFAFHGKHYVFVVAVTGIFEISELAAEIIRLFLTGAASDGEAVYTTPAIESRSLVAHEVVNALRARYPIHSILQGMSELQA